MKFPWSKPPPPPPPPPPLIDSTFAAIATVVVVLLAIVVTRKKKAKPLRRPQALASAALLRAQLSDPALLVEFDDAEYRSVRDGADWTDLKAALKPRKTLDTVRPWSVGTHGTETWNMDCAGVPSAFARCSNVADVQACIRHATTINSGRHGEQNPLCVAGGRHSHLCLLDDSLVLDLSLMRGVTVDAAQKTVTCEGGALNGDAVMACAPLGMGFTVGAHPGTGLGGLTLQGGHGSLERLTGLTIDSLVGCTVVLADGSRKDASADTNTELFWALRGGCGNFGVVVSFTFKLHPVGEGGMVMQAQRVHLPFLPMVKLLGWPDRAACVRAWADFAQDIDVAADRDVNSVMVLVAGGPVIHQTDVYCASLAASRTKLEAQPFATSFGKPVDSHLKPVSYFHDVCFAPFGPSGDGQLAGCYYMSGAMFNSLPEGAVQALAVAAATNPSKEAFLIVSMIGGKAADVPVGATAYAQRGARFFVVIAAAWQPSGNAATYTKRRDACKAWVHETKAALQPYALGAYGQLAGNASTYDEQTSHEYHTPGEGTYGWASNLERLRAAKAKFDPQDLFVNTDHIKKA